MDSIIHLLSVSRCHALNATPSSVLRLWLPVLKASFVSSCDLGSGCCEKRAGKPCWRPPWFCLGGACLSFVACAGPFTSLILILTLWLDFLAWTQTCCIDMDLCGSHWSVPDPGYCSWPALLSSLRFCGVVPCVSKDTARAYLVALSSCLALQSCCSLTLKAFLHSVWLWQLWGILWWDLTNIYFWDMENDLEIHCFTFPRNEFCNIFFHHPKLLEHIWVYNPHWKPPISTATPTSSPATVFVT